MSESKWVKFRKRSKPKSRKTDIYSVLTTSKGSDGNYLIGIVKWYPQWRQYTFFPNAETLYNQECLHDIANFVKELNLEHKGKRRKERSNE